MDVSFYIARRYLVSKKSNNAINIISWISIFAIAITTAALVIILSAMNGMTDTVANLYNTFEPDIRITAAKGKYFNVGDEFLQRIKSVEGVSEVSKTLSDKVLIKNIDKQALVSVKGVDQQFNKITNINSSIVEGTYDLYSSEYKKSIILGQGIANELQVNMHVFVNELSVYSPVRGKSSSLNPADDLNQIYCRPGGVFYLNDQLDYQFAFVSLETARELFDRPNQVSALELKCNRSTDDIVEELKQILGGDFVVKDRYQLNDVLFKSLETEKLATFIILAFILVIATFNIIGALTMLIIEKKRDIKTLYSLGADLRLIRNIFMNEAFLISSLGALSGLLLGVVVCWIQIRFHVVGFGNDYVLPYFPVQLQFKDCAWIFGLIMVISFLAALYPIRVFTKTDLVH